MTESVAVIEAGKLVSFRYSLLDAGGRILEHSEEPVSYLHGNQSALLPVVERALAGHKAGDEVEVEVNPDDGFGKYDPGLTFTEDLDKVPPDFRELGAQVEMRNEAGESRMFSVTKIENGKVTVDANHPLAGLVVKFVLRIEEVRDPGPGELGEGGHA